MQEGFSSGGAEGEIVLGGAALVCCPPCCTTLALVCLDFHRRLDLYIVKDCGYSYLLGVLEGGGGGDTELGWAGLLSFIVLMSNPVVCDTAAVRHSSMAWHSSWLCCAATGSEHFTTWLFHPTPFFPCHHGIQKLAVARSAGAAVPEPRRLGLLFVFFVCLLFLICIAILIWLEWDALSEVIWERGRTQPRQAM